MLFVKIDSEKEFLIIKSIGIPNIRVYDCHYKRFSYAGAAAAPCQICDQPQTWAPYYTAMKISKCNYIGKKTQASPSPSPTLPHVHAGNNVNSFFLNSTPSYIRNASNDFRSRLIETVSARERLHHFARLRLVGSLPFLVIRRVSF